ncbi:pyrimidine-specific ribonucleoside hydrolase RihA [Actinomadura vinacea]|uniref:Pyrimidine-specific ribonucleoside hydrolase RihA n=2 Tax=Actinomadura vinacea TaxID=115336 RepID=A0ABN3JNY3_9ACTN
MFAILLAAAHPGIELLAVTTVAGNGPLEAVTANALRICTLAGLDDVVVAAGADRALRGDRRTAPDIHGESALDGADLPEPAVPLAADDAVTVMARLLEEAGRPVTIAATGPLTNVATLLDRRPDLTRRIERIVFMGGSAGRGNTMPLAEFNVFVDPEAADRVLRCGLPLLMCGLDVTHQALATPEVFARLRAIGGTLPATCEGLLRFFAGAYEEVYGMPDPPVHDPVAIAAIVEPDVVECVEAPVVVELDGAHTRGATVVDLHRVTGAAPNARVAMGLDAGRFWDLMLDAVRTLAR